MKASEIAAFRDEPRPGAEWLSLLMAQNHWLREIAFQLATFNGILAGDVEINIHHHHHKRHKDREWKEFSEEIIKQMKQLSDEAKQAILDALTGVSTEIIEAGNAAAKTETDQIVKFLEGLQTQGGPITKEDVGGIIEMIKGIAPKVKEAVTASIDKISTGAGADTGAGTGTGDGGTPKP